MAELAYILEDGNRVVRAERVYLDRQNPLEGWSDEKLIADFRFPRASILEIVGMCQSLERRTRRSHALPVYLQVLAALRFYAKGVFQNDLKGLTGISQSQLSRCIRDVSNVLASCANQQIRFPAHGEELRNRKQNFFELAEFPNVIGAIDGSLIKIQSPSQESQHLYVSRKGGHSLNIQVICDSKMMFLNVVAKWPGATHDSFIWRNSGIRQQFLEQPPNGHLLGDSGYPCEPWLMTPFLRTNLPEQENYNRAHKKTRRIVENAIGLWKSVFRRIDGTGGIMIYKPEKACKIVIATAVLHNLRRKLKLAEDEDFVHREEVQAEPAPAANDLGNEVIRRGQQVRNDLVENVFLN